MSAKLWQQLTDSLGERATTDIFERRFYERDLGPVPDFLVNNIAKPMPDIIVRPNTVEETAEIVKAAAAEHVPITARAGGSTVYFNSVCANQGVLADLNAFDGVRAINQDAGTVRVGAGTTWSSLERTLNREGLAVLAYPSSAPAASVGGWLAMKGYGIGSLRYGQMAYHVDAAQTVLADGSIQELTKTTDVPVSWMAAAEGTLGIMTELTLKVRKRPEAEWHGLAECKDAASMQAFIEQAAEASDKPFNLHFSDPGCNALRHRHGLASEQAANSYTVAYDVDGTKSQVNTAVQHYNKLLETAGADDMSEEAAEEWQHRFFSLILKREGPSLLGAEIWLPINKLAAYLKDVNDYEAKHKLGLKTYGHVVTPKYAMVMTMFNADERNTVGYVQGLALVKKVHDIGARYGGSPYGIGLWNTPYLSRCYTSTQLAELKRRKKMLDPQNIMNPGKLYQAPLFLHPVLFGIGMDVLVATRAFYQGRNNA